MKEMQPQLPVNPEMIRLARESRELAQVDLARMLDVRQSKISKIEAGFLQIGDEELANLADKLDYPTSFFRWPDSVYGFATYEMFHRRRQRVPARSLTRIHAEMNLRQMQLRRLLRSTMIEGDEFLRIDPDEYDGDIEQIARAVRAAWKLPPGPIRDLTATIEAAGGVIVKEDFRTRQVDAVSQWLPGLPPMFFVNIDVPTDRLRLTLAHEIGHVVMHTTVHPQVEEEATRFAAEFLMPATEIRHQLVDAQLSTLADLKRYWRVSMWALIVRAHNLGTISERQYRRFCMRMTQMGYQKREPIEIEPEEPTTLAELVQLHLTSLEYEPVDLATFLGRRSPTQLPGIAQSGLRLVS